MLAAERLGIVNLKNAIYVQADGTWKTHFVQGTEGLSNWSVIFETLDHLDYQGPICFSGQYSDASVPVEERLRVDQAVARSCAVTSGSGDPSGK